MKRERWTEADVLALPSEESDAFERKSGRILDDTEQFLRVISKAISAMANSGGGSIILGAEDNGILLGVDPVRGKENIRDWLEQKIPSLTSYPLSEFRVHTVERADLSSIPNDKVIIVIDVADSSLAPHQSVRDHLYYHRSGGRSVPAPHFYIELLRQRLTHAALKLSVTSIDCVGATLVKEGLFVAFEVAFHIENVGSVTAYQFRISARGIETPEDSYLAHLIANYVFARDQFPSGITSHSNYTIDSAILPGCAYKTTGAIGIRLHMTEKTPNSLLAALALMINGTIVDYRLATETSVGETTRVRLDEFLAADKVSDFILQRFGPFTR